MPKNPHHLSGLIKFASRSPWAELLDESLSNHLEPALHEAGLDAEDLFEMIEPAFEGALWGCAFEDLMTQEIEPDGLNLVEDYLKRRGWNETAPNKEYMQALRHSVMSLYEVSEVVPGQSMKLRDLLREREAVTVMECSATQTLVNWDKIAARVLKVRSGYRISGAVLPFETEVSAELMSAVAELSETDSEPGFDWTDREQLLGHLAPLFTAIWLRAYVDTLAGAELPELVNSDGEDVVFHRIAFPIAKGVTQKSIEQQLDAVRDLSATGAKSWSWLSAAAKRSKRRAESVVAIATAMNDGSPLFGNVVLRGRQVIIEVNSAERAAIAQARMREWLDGLVGNPLTEIRTLAQMFADQAESPSRAHEPPFDPQQMKSIVHSVLDREYANALDAPVPMLDDETPRRLASTESGRAKVAEWLKFLENRTARARSPDDPMASYDFRWMWEELDVADLRK